MKTNIKLNVTHGDYVQFCKVKLDKNKFPYVVVDNEKIIINSTKFPRTVKTQYGLMELTLELLSGQKELEEILNNPALTADKLTVQQQMRLA